MKNKLIIILFLAMLFLVACSNEQIAEFLEIDYPIGQTFEINASFKEAITIASWNIENFGKTKASDPERMKKIADILSHYDIVAIQEISNIDEEVDIDCDRNADAFSSPNYHLIKNSLKEYLPSNYEVVISPQVFDERYGFVYNKDRVEYMDSWFASDEGDIGQLCSTESKGNITRNPYSVKFRKGNWSFVLINVHTSPSNNINELNTLEYIYERYGCDNCFDTILIGDLNADCSYLKERSDTDLYNPENYWVFEETGDSTVSATVCQYDQMIFRNITSKVVNHGIFTEGITDDISDHYLIWAKFTTQ